MVSAARAQNDVDLQSLDWTTWGGPNGDFTVDAKGLLDKWPADGPKQLWKRTLGEGYSSILCKDGNLFTSFSTADEEVVVSLDAASGRTNWEYRYARKIWDDMRLGFGLGPNATPLIVDDRIISIGIAGQLRCLDLATGKLHWQQDLSKEFGRRKRIEEYGYSASPLLYDNKVIVQVGGENHAVVAFNPKDGAVEWKSEAGGISYGAASISRLAGQDQFIYFEPEGVVAIDPTHGKLLWRWRVPVDNGNHLTPVVKCDDDHLFVASQFSSGGGRLLNITKQGGKFTVKELWFTARLRASSWTQIKIGDYIYGSAGGHKISFFVAFNWRTGKIAWRKRAFHVAQCLYADEKLIVLDQEGNLALATVSPEGHEIHGNVKITERVSWTAPTLVGKKLFIRDRKNILALDLAAANNER
jgi:outer membrane protein assembly factor BamB